MPASVTGQVTEIILARFEPNEDLYGGLIDVIKERDVRAGVVMSITGGITEASLSYYPHSGPIESTRPSSIHIKGPLEASGHGIIGREGDEPYLHVHLTVSNSEGSVCGHLKPGTYVRSLMPMSHFTVFIARVTGVELRYLWNRQPNQAWSTLYPEGLPYHALVDVSGPQ